MRSGQALWALGFVLGTVGTATAGCGGDDDDSTCLPGTEGCACTADGACNAGLSCTSNLCVDTSSGGAAGGGGTGGGPTGGSGGSGPAPGPIDKIDLLFVLDNSISMADKQEILRDAVPQLVGRLIDPLCVDADSGAPVSPSVTESQGCPAGSEPQFRPIDDIHIGLITSSLASQGGVLCSPEHGMTYWNETQNDRGRLIARAGPSGVAPITYDANNYLAWDPGAQKDPPGESDPAALIQNLQNLVAGAGEQGCGYEATLEAWYRFLVQPDPPMDVAVNTTTGMAEPEGLDDVLLAQRAQFLRPDSLLAIVMLTDENDCSIVVGGDGYLMGDTREGALPRSTSVCDLNPNDPCCMSCTEQDPPPACGAPMADPKCQQAPTHGEIDSSQDRLSLRCYEQKRRFGTDYLYPTSRYVEGLTSREVENRDGLMGRNPLFRASSVYSDLTPRADNSRILLVGIVGVPWQDIATEQSLADPVLLEYLTATEITQAGIWETIVGRSAASPPVAPTDPFMIQSPQPRSGTNPRTGVDITPPQPEAGGNPINGHEYTILNNGDLQYACIFPLTTPRECLNVEPGVGCDCKVSNEVLNRPLCEGTTQVYAKAYPGTRILQVLRDYGPNSVVASICPKNTAIEITDPNYGYNPAVAALLHRLPRSGSNP